MKYVSELLGEGHDLSGFDSGKPALDEWLRTSARHAAAMHTGRTFIWHAGDCRVVAYFTLAGHLVAREEFASRVGRGSPDLIPAILLARLALDRALQGLRLGGELLWDALTRAAAANRQVAVRLVVVDAIDDGAASFYAHHGFSPIPGDPLRLVQKMSSIQTALSDHGS